MIKVAINGFGRIGRLVFRIMDNDPNFDVVAINDLTDSEQLAYLLKYDTNHRNYKVNEISYDDSGIIVSSKHINVYSEMDPINLPWKELGIDIVFECTGKFTKYEDAYKHIEAGAKKVIVSAPGKNMKTIVYNVNDDILDSEDKIISAASCTTNCLAPVVDVIEKNIGIEVGFMTTVHAYTNDQVTLDVAHKKGANSRRGRACAMNIVPSSTGAASALGEVIPSLKGKMNGSALRVPTSTGSMIDLTLQLRRNVTSEEINELLKSNVSETLGFTMDPIVSSDIIGSTVGALVDGLLTKVLESGDKQLVKIVAWYDNEFGYSTQMVRTALKFMQK